jgi:hypothetical protein
MKKTYNTTISKTSQRNCVSKNIKQWILTNKVKHNLEIADKNIQHVADSVANNIVGKGL